MLTAVRVHTSNIQHLHAHPHARPLPARAPRVTPQKAIAVYLCTLARTRTLPGSHRRKRSRCSRTARHLLPAQGLSVPARLRPSASPVRVVRRPAATTLGVRMARILIADHLQGCLSTVISFLVTHICCWLATNDKLSSYLHRHQVRGMTETVTSSTYQHRCREAR